MPRDMWTAACAACREDVLWSPADNLSHKLITFLVDGSRSWPADNLSR